MTPLLHEMQFRSCPLLELKSLGELAPDQRQRFRELEGDPEFYGLLVARPPLLMNLMSVERPIAELFQSLVTPSRLAARDEAMLADVVDLVLDGVLEVESEHGFVSGADALPMFGRAEVDDAHALSHAALLHGEDLETRDPLMLTVALYHYNRIPVTPFWKSRFESADAILAHLGADQGTLHALLEQDWIASRNVPGFLSWSPRVPMRRGEDGLTYKLYVSPRPERIRDAFEIVVRVLANFPDTPFKIGNSVAGLLRPDKLMLYFPLRERMTEVASVLLRELAGCEAHGVPFSAPLDEHGLLSWGVDPPDAERVLRWLGRESWRYWVAKRLGSALAVAKSARTPSAVEPWRFALERARRHGIDIETWTPGARLWSNA